MNFGKIVHNMQDADLKNAYFDITGRKKGISRKLRFRSFPFAPLIHYELTACKDISILKTFADCGAGC